MIATEAFYHCVLWSMNEVNKHYGFKDLLLWSPGTMEYKGINSHNPLTIGARNPSAPTAEEEEEEKKLERENAVRKTQVPYRPWKSLTQEQKEIAYAERALRKLQWTPGHRAEVQAKH
ncbi:hypothetical protein V8F06_007277 [Rhypophila decipiens]